MSKCTCRKGATCPACLSTAPIYKAKDGPGCLRHAGDPHNLCPACWKLEPDNG